MTILCGTEAVVTARPLTNLSEVTTVFPFFVTNALQKLTNYQFSNVTIVPERKMHS